MKLDYLFLSPGGTGGINSQVGLLANSLSRNGKRVVIHFTTASKRLKLVSSFWLLFSFPFVLVYHKPRLTYIPLASGGSTYRKLIYGLILRLMKKSYVIHIHGGGFEDFYSQLRPGMQTRVKNFFSGAKHIYILHKAQGVIVREIMGEANHKLSVLPNGVSIPEKSISYPAPTQFDILDLIFVGDLIARKGVLDLIQLKDFFEGSGIRLTFVGRTHHDVQKAIDVMQPESEKVLRFLGELTHSETLQQIARSHLLVLPSYIENFPNVILEAFSLGVPVIATDVGGIGEIISDGVNGWIINSSGDRKYNLRTVFRKANSSRHKLLEMSNNAKVTSERFFDIKRLSIQFENETAGL
jgi:glycosyltransferase involved in cell wall biosynthesis